MSPEERLKEIAVQLADGKNVPQVTVREFLSWFSAQRRGYSIVQEIRKTLAGAAVKTDPDFESA